jgi:hypothetical protein
MRKCTGGSESEGLQTGDPVFLQSDAAGCHEMAFQQHFQLGIAPLREILALSARFHGRTSSKPIIKWPY